LQHTCYLCGKTIEGTPSSDHVPPRQFFARAIRSAFNLDKLATLPSHPACNAAFGLDEEYFVQTLAPIADSPTARPIVQEFAAHLRAGRRVALGYRVLKQFLKDLSGLVLPHGLVAMRVEGSRLKRVIWKIVRGLYRIETSQVLPEDTPFMVEIVEPENRDPSKHEKFWEAVKAQPSKGVYGAIFDYKHLHLVSGKAEVHVWGLLLWDRIMVFVSHQAPGSEAAT